MSAQNRMAAEAVDRKMRPRLLRIDRLRRVVRCLTAVVYSVTLGWFVCCFGIAFFGMQLPMQQTEDTWLYVLGGFAVFVMLHGALMYSLTVLRNREMRVMCEAIRLLFPDAAYRACCSVPRRMLADSSFFAVLHPDEAPGTHTVYGCVEFHQRGALHTLYDIGVTASRFAQTIQWMPVLGFAATLYRSVVRPLFGAPIESARYGFRGMFGVHDGLHACRGSVILLPDHLENKIGYLAHAIQAYRRKNGARLVVLEDPEFEQFFSVYADDEVEARKILTPAVMRRITALRSTFGKDLMISFSGEKIYYAAEIPGGFLRPARKSLKARGLFCEIHHEIALIRTLPETLFAPQPLK